MIDVIEKFAGGFVMKKILIVSFLLILFSGSVFLGLLTAETGSYDDCMLNCSFKFGSRCFMNTETGEPQNKERIEWCKKEKAVCEKSCEKYK